MNRMNHGTALLVLSAAIAAALATACHRNDEQAAADAYGTDAPATTTPASGETADAAAYPDSATADTADAMASGPIQDTTFYQDALDGGHKEVAAATLASSTAQDAGVKAFADTLVKDHTAMNQQVMDASGMADTAPPASDATATADLQGKTGADFDLAFVDMMVTDHQKTIALFENAAANASTDEAKSLARQALPQLRAHLQTAQDLQGKLGGATPAM